MIFGWDYDRYYIIINYMKLAVFSDAFLPQVNGMVSHLLETLPLLSNKHQILLVVPRPRSKIDLLTELKNIEIVYLSGIPSYIYKDWQITLPFSPYIQKKVSQFKPNIIHFHGPLTVSLNGLIFANQKHIPCVGSFHGYFMEPEYLKIVGLDKFGLHKSKLLNKLLWKYSNIVYNRTNTIICPSEATKKDLIDHGHNKPVVVISNGINLHQKKELKIKYKLPQNYFLHVGRLSKEKNIEILIEAIKKTDKKINLLIVGDGPIKTTLEKMVMNKGLSKRIIFLGMIPYTQLPSSNIYKNAIAFITTSTSETQGITILEAMREGLPIIGVNAKALPELIVNNGILCDPDNIDQISKSMVLLNEDKEMRQRYAGNSLLNVKKHNVSNTVRKLESVYNSLI